MATDTWARRRRHPAWRRWATGVLLAAAVSGLVAWVDRLDLLAPVEVSAGDVLFKIRAPRAARSTVIVGIDQRSYQALLPEHGPLSQWPRTLYARALDQLTGGGAAGVPGPRVVAFNIFFDGTRPEDGALAEAVRRAGNVVLPVVAQGPLAVDPEPGIAQRFQVFIRPSPQVGAAAAGEGLVNVTAARDTVVRSLPVLLRTADEEVPSLALTVAALYARRPVVLDRPPSPGAVHAAGRDVPVDAADAMAINFLGRPTPEGRERPFPVISFVDVLEGRFDRAAVQDRIVLIGPTIRGVDEHPTPTTSHTRMWGVEVLANAVETVVHQRFLVPVGPATSAAAGAALALGAAALVAWLSPWAAGAGVVLLLGGYLTLAAVLFEVDRVLDLVHPPAALLLAFAAALAHRVVFVESERRVVQEAMGRYLSPAVSRWVLEDPRRLALGGESRPMTVLFSDLRDFTRYAHALPPEVVVALLNRYRSAMTAIVLRHDGVLAQYAGDAIEAFWNAPMDQPDHARRACAAAVDMVAAVAALRPEFARSGWEHLDIGVGINTGRMIVGNMGSQERLVYTAVGDAVNVAARLEGLTKEYAVHVVAGEDARAAAGDAFAFRFLDVVQVRGRSEPVAVYEVLGPAGEIDPARAALLDRYHEGVAHYRARRWAEAEKVFADLTSADPGDGPAALYLERARRALQDPPPPDWDGVHRVETK